MEVPFVGHYPSNRTYQEMLLKLSSAIYSFLAFISLTGNFECGIEAGKTKTRSSYGLKLGSIVFVEVGDTDCTGSLALVGDVTTVLIPKECWEGNESRAADSVQGETYLGEEIIFSSTPLKMEIYGLVALQLTTTPKTTAAVPAAQRKLVHGTPGTAVILKQGMPVLWDVHATSGSSICDSLYFCVIDGSGRMGAADSGSPFFTIEKGKQALAGIQKEYVNVHGIGYNVYYPVYVPQANTS